MLFMVQPSFSEQNVVTDMPIANIGEMKRLTTNHSKVCVVCIRWGHVPNSHHTLQTTDKKKHTQTQRIWRECRQIYHHIHIHLSITGILFVIILEY